MTVNIHASCIEVNGTGILLLGNSGAGKSDISLRLIENHQAKLVADDRVNLDINSGQLIASCPENIKGQLEVRGIGIVTYPYIEKTVIKIAVNLTDKKIERLPEKHYYNFANISVPMIYLDSREPSSTAKLLSALRLLL